MFTVRQTASPVSPGWVVGATRLQSVTVKGEFGSFIEMILFGLLQVSWTMPHNNKRTLATWTNPANASSLADHALPCAGMDDAAYLIFEGAKELCETEPFGFDVLWVVLPFLKCFLGFELDNGHSFSVLCNKQLVGHIAWNGAHQITRAPCHGSVFFLSVYVETGSKDCNDHEVSLCK
jgi:hypothetical protein